MKDYSMNSFERQIFILNYEKYEDHFVVNFASGLKMYVEYNKELEEKILDIMKMQVLNSDEKADKLASDVKTYVVPFGIIGFGSFSSVYHLVSNQIANNEDPTYMMVMGAILLSLGVSQFIRGFKSIFY